MKDLVFKNYSYDDWKNNTDMVCNKVASIIHSDPFSWNIRGDTPKKTLKNADMVFKREFAGNDNNFIAIAYLKNNPVCFVFVENSYNNAWEGAYIMTHFASRGKGYAYFLMQDVFKTIKDKGAETIITNVYETNKKSKELCKKLGFFKMEDCLDPEGDKQEIFRRDIK